MDHQGILVVVSGFSGAGKGTLMKELLRRYDNYALSISATTREPRELTFLMKKSVRNFVPQPNEINGMN